jgi:ketosteroid isomerase-like protein
MQYEDVLYQSIMRKVEFKTVENGRGAFHRFAVNSPLRFIVGERNMADNKNLIQDFYTAFQARDHAAMIACYHQEVHFRDPVFLDLHGSEAKAMWHMLCERGKDLTIDFNRIQANDTAGSAHWEARYTFSTGRKVHNIIDATFEFKDGKISRHEDVFDLWRWTRQALGPAGVLLGWSPIIKSKVRQTAWKGLDAFILKHPQYQE